MSHGGEDLELWLSRVSQPGWVWYLKYLAANDTYAKRNVHQGGPYLSKELLRTAFPQLTRRARSERNPDLQLSVEISSHRIAHDIRVVWYNSRQLEHRPKGRDEARMTNWGGQDHPLLTAEATGSLVVFAFQQSAPGHDAQGCEVWIADNPTEEDEVTAIVGTVEPGKGVMYVPSQTLPLFGQRTQASPCILTLAEIRGEWMTALPSGEDILEMTLHRSPSAARLRVDARLMRRRACEYELFQSLENHVVLPRVRQGFTTVEEFVSFAHTVTNRRKARAGRSLELHARAIFNEEGVAYSWTPKTEGKRTPDFIFPSIRHYQDAQWPESKLRLLAAKTTCKDRWRQILNEAARIRVKHLLTLQEGVAENQFLEMKEEGVQLVIPAGLIKAYAESVQDELITLETFIREVTSLEN